MELPARPGLATLGGWLHDGAVMSVSDLTGALFAGAERSPEGTGWTTVESTTYFRRPVRWDKTAAAVARLFIAGDTR